METAATRNMTVRTGIALILLPVLVLVIAYQAGAVDGYIRGRIQRGDFDQEAKGRIMPISQGHIPEYSFQWYGIWTLQYPTDLVVYQEIIYQVKPDVIIEAGTFQGGLTLYLATLLDMINSKGKVFTVDIEPKFWKETLAKLDLEQKQRLLDRIVSFSGSSTDPAIIQEIAKQIPKDAKVLVILDSLHTKDHVLQELKLYSPFVSLNSYVIVNDTQTEGETHDGVVWGPLSAAREFLAGTDQFKQDDSVDRFMVSCAHSGFLKRVK